MKSRQRTRAERRNRERVTMRRRYARQRKRAALLWFSLKLHPPRKRLKPEVRAWLDQVSLTVAANLLVVASGDSAGADVWLGSWCFPEQSVLEEWRILAAAPFDPDCGHVPPDCEPRP